MIDRHPDQQLELVELMIAKSDVERTAITQRRPVRSREKSPSRRLVEGPTPMWSEATWHRMQAEFDLKSHSNEEFRHRLDSSVAFEPSGST